MRNSIEYIHSSTRTHQTDTIIEQPTQNLLLISILTEHLLCPVKTYKLYTSKLNKNVPFLWQRAKSGGVFYNDKVWYEPRVVGQDPLNRFMKFLMKDVKLSSQEYTNHSIRATCITTLDRAGFEARHIMKLSSHKNESSIKEYATECPDDKKKEMFASLSHAIAPKNLQADLPKDLHTPENLVQLPKDMQLEPIDDWDTIDDELLSNLIYETTVQTMTSKENLGLTNTVTNAKSAQNPPKTIVNSQVNTVNTVNNSTRGRILPQMYFPNSNVTINYHFHK